MDKKEFISKIIKKRKNKTKASYSINDDVLEKINNYSKTNNLNKSQIVENLLLVFMESIYY